MKTADRVMYVAGLVLLFGGLNLAILLSHMSRLVGIVFILAGIGALLWAAKGEKAVAKEKTAEDNIASRLVNLVTLEGRLKLLIPAAGIAVLVAVASFNLFLRDGFYLGSNDYVALVLAAVFLAYNYIPAKYRVERDFALLFVILLFVFLVIPTTLLSLGGGETDTNTPLIYYLLAMPTAALSNLLGIAVVSPVTDPMTGLRIYNMMEVPGPDGFPIPLSIGLSCTGLYSVAIFVSAFIAFVAVEYKKADRKVALLLALGIFLAWVANILRMTIIIIVGRYHGAEAMQWTHNNIGELIFMAWITVFWLVMFRYFGVLDREPVKEESPQRKKGLCQHCGKPLSPASPSVKCECGRVAHADCISANDGKCPSCGADMKLEIQDEKIS
jgi:exosortase/archaeosortase family protein